MVHYDFKKDHVGETIKGMVININTQNIFVNIYVNIFVNIHSRFFLKYQ